MSDRFDELYDMSMGKLKERFKNEERPELTDNQVSLFLWAFRGARDELRAKIDAERAEKQKLAAEVKAKEAATTSVLASPTDASGVQVNQGTAVEQPITGPADNSTAQPQPTVVKTKGILTVTHKGPDGKPLMTTKNHGKLTAHGTRKERMLESAKKCFKLENVPIQLTVEGATVDTPVATPAVVEHIQEQSSQQEPQVPSTTDAVVDTKALTPDCAGCRLALKDKNECKMYETPAAMYHNKDKRCHAYKQG